MVGSYVLTRLASTDLAHIWNYTYDEWSETQADEYYHSLIESFEVLAVSPSLGTRYFEISEGLFGMIVKKHIVFYRQISTERIEILRVLHARMDIKSQFHL